MRHYRYNKLVLIGPYRSDGSDKEHIKDMKKQLDKPKLTIRADFKDKTNLINAILTKPEYAKLRDKMGIPIG